MWTPNQSKPGWKGLCLEVWGRILVLTWWPRLDLTSRGFSSPPGRLKIGLSGQVQGGSRRGLAVVIVQQRPPRVYATCPGRGQVRGNECCHRRAFTPAAPLPRFPFSRNVYTWLLFLLLEEC